MKDRLHTSVNDAGVNVLALVKDDDEKYIWMYRDHQREEVLRGLGRAAGNPELSFSWYDAAVMSQKVRTVTT